MRASKLLSAIAAGALCLGASACGIPVDEQAHPVVPPPGPFQALSTPAPAGDLGPVTETLYFIRDDALVAVKRQVAKVADTLTIVQDIIAGPNDAERATGFATALSGAGIVDNVQVQDGRAIVTLGPALQTGRDDQILAFGQIVCTLDARTDVDTVVFVYDGQVVGVPRGNGSLTTSPLTAADYENVRNPQHT